MNDVPVHRPSASRPVRPELELLSARTAFGPRPPWPRSPGLTIGPDTLRFCASPVAQARSIPRPATRRDHAHERIHGQPAPTPTVTTMAVYPQRQPCPRLTRLSAPARAMICSEDLPSSTRAHCLFSLTDANRLGLRSPLSSETRRPSEDGDGEPSHDLDADPESWGCGALAGARPCRARCRGSPVIGRLDLPLDSGRSDR